ncbi:uncharacterized protein LOC101203522 isoform X2 [Cucumis sativus]|uniref:Bacterial Ig-like domain-containing protein n=1 Tax=Cucumis sativus TaxID=3659 RepID=A0A0A0LU47_CUCSA|nr:uncharacterized protein LOC101203522 isoform X2 [Cucumis sativus]KGN64322.1 hypothetical protein Csa_013287 [Cucumis sativus]
MGLLKVSVLVRLCWIFSLLCFGTRCHGAEVTVKFLEAPDAFSRLKSATFLFEILVNGHSYNCKHCNISCSLDNRHSLDCNDRKIFYSKLEDGEHKFKVCTNFSKGAGCSSYKWTVDTVSPTASIMPLMTFTNALNVSVNISFSEPCNGSGGFRCSSVEACNLLVYGEGRVIPSSFKILQPKLKYSLSVALPSTVQYGRIILVMDKNFCTDRAGNIFTRTENSISYVHFDRRKLLANLKTRVPERLLQLNSDTRLVQATNKHDNLKVYLYFSEPVLNSSLEVLNALEVSDGALLPISGRTLGNRKFSFSVTNVSGIAIITVSLKPSSIISRQGNPVSPLPPVTFLYDSLRPTVMLSTTTYKRTTEKRFSVSVNFVKPVFDFNSSCIFIRGGRLVSFREMGRNIYSVEVQAEDEVVSVSVPENVTADVAGNHNLASNVLQMWHYSIPTISTVASIFTIASFTATSLAAGLLTVSTASLQSEGVFMRSSSSLTYNPTRNIFRIACHIQIFALSVWLPVTLPVEYYEFAKGLQWSIPYLRLPWEDEHDHPDLSGYSPFTGSNPYLSKTRHSDVFQNKVPGNNFTVVDQLYGLPLTPMEYRSFFESQNIKPQADNIFGPGSYSQWNDFYRSMFWFGIFAGSLIFLHALFLFIMKCRKKIYNTQGSYGALTFPRFEIFITFVALASMSMASGVLFRGGALAGVIVGVLLLGILSLLLLALLLFLSVGITFGKLLQYKEVHQEGQKFHWYQELVRVTLGPGKRSQWTWKNQPNSVYLIIFGPMFEDLRGPPKYMLSQISVANPNKRGDRIIASDDETEDAEAPFIQKLFGILRIYYTLFEFIRRVTLGIMAGAYKETISSRTPIVTLLCISSFQLFFLVLKKPFIKKKVQLVEIISNTCEVGLFAICAVLLDKEFSITNQTKIGITLLVLFLIGYCPQLINEWYALYKQVKQLDFTGQSFFSGLKVAFIGFLLLFLPQRFTKNLESIFTVNLSGDSETVDNSSDRNMSGSRSSSNEKPWLKQLRKLAKASFTKDQGGTSNDPSGSGTQWTGFWGRRSRSRSSRSSSISSSDFRSKSKGLYKEFETIFSTK